MSNISMEHGSGGSATSKLIDEIFAAEFSNEVLAQMEDAAVVAGSKKIAITTDSFVVTPVIYKGGNIGRLAICGTVNDMLMRGSVPMYITCGFILEEGLDFDVLKKVVHEMAETAKEANVIIVAGDTKVVEGNGGLYINTTGVGFVDENLDISANKASDKDVIIVSGNLGDHHATILSERMEITNSIKSDNAPLNDIVRSLIENDIEVHVLRDVTRGGLATVLKELAKTSNKNFIIEETALPVDNQVKDFCGLLGLDPLYMGNEGKLIAIVSEKDKDKALDIMKNSKYGENSTIIGTVEDNDDNGQLVLKTKLGGKRILDILQGEGLPRIC